MIDVTVFKRTLPYWFALLFVGAFILSQHQLIAIPAMHLHSGGTDEGSVRMPYTLKESGRKQLDFDTTVQVNALTSAQIKIIPDDCIESLRVNRQHVDISQLRGRCDWTKGIRVDLEPFLHEGKNRLEITVQKKDGIGGLKVFGVYDHLDPVHLLLQFLLMFGAVGWVVSATRKSLPLPLSVLLASSVLLQLHYLSYTDYATRTFDLLIATGHFDYIQMIAHHLTLPNPTEGWEYHQPPLYYLGAAAVFALFEHFPVIDAMTALQLFSLFLFTVFLYFGLRILHLLIKDQRGVIFASALFVFWPAGIIHSVRIGNDALFFTLFAAGLFLIVRWENGQSQLWKALLLASLTLVTKANGIILFGIIGILLLLEFYRERNRHTFLRQCGLAGLFFFTAFFINFVDNIYYALSGGGSDWLVSNVINTINQKLYVANEAFNYLYFDLKTYLEEPFINPWDDRYGRQFFWNYLFKSALFSEFFFPDAKTIAVVMGAFSLILFAYILLGMLTAKRSPGLSVMGLTLLISLAALLLYRIKIPVACNTDFRYVYPVLIPMAYFYAQALNYLKAQRLVVPYTAGIAAAFFFSLGTVAVFL